MGFKLFTFSLVLCLSACSGYVNAPAITSESTTPTQSSVASGSENDDSVTSVHVVPGAQGSFAGFIVSLGDDFLRSNICAGKTIFGRAGTAVCGALFGDVAVSNMNRDRTTTPMSMSAEMATSVYATGYRDVPMISKDDEGYHSTAIGCTAGGGNLNTCTSVVPSTRPGTNCGLSGTVTQRIADCVTVNGASATWNGSVKATGPEAAWNLVTRISPYEVWKDSHTGFLWSDAVDSLNWCNASGSSGGGPLAEADVSAYCTSGANQNQATPFSACAEVSGFQSPNGEDYATGVYSDQKGGLGLLSTPALRWRLPTLADFKQADIDGIRFVLPNMNDGGVNSGYRWFWTATVNSTHRDEAWIYNGSTGQINSITRDNAGALTICIGR